jgi:hypothetical protein
VWQPSQAVNIDRKTTFEGRGSMLRLVAQNCPARAVL